MLKLALTVAVVSPASSLQ